MMVSDATVDVLEKKDPLDFSNFRKVFIFSDLHGNYKAFCQVMDQIEFDYEKDLFISIGDLCDGYGQTVQLLNHISTIPNKILIKGNHDVWLQSYLYDALNETNTIDKEFALWTSNGGNKTLLSYEQYCIDNNLDKDQYLQLAKKHLDLFDSQVLCHYVERDKTIICHGGIPNMIGITLDKILDKDCPKYIQYEIYWDRNTYIDALKRHKSNELNYDFHMNDDDLKDKEFIPKKIDLIEGVEKVIIGHTEYNTGDPEWLCDQVLNIDTGAGNPGGRLCVLEYNSMTFKFSSISKKLYPNYNWDEN